MNEPSESPDVLTEIISLRSRIREMESLHHLEIEMQRAIVDILELIESTSDLPKVLQFILQIIKYWSGCDALGIRIADSAERPFLAQSGFAPQDAKNPVHHPLECVCHLTMDNLLPKDSPHVTPFGSFWVNNTRSLENLTETLRIQKCQNPPCLLKISWDGNNPVALCIIPLKYADTIHGTLQLIFLKPGQLKLETIQLYESLAISLGQALNSQIQNKLNRQLTATNKVLFHEVIHRTRNHLQLMASLVGVQETFTADPQFKQDLFKIRSRMNVYNQIQSQLYTSKSSLVEIDLNKLVYNIWQFLKNYYFSETQYITLKKEISNDALHIEQAGALGLVLHELLLNAIYHAWPETRRDKTLLIQINVGTTVTARVCDNGIGRPDATPPARQFGLTLINNLVTQQLGGQLAWDWDSRCECRFSFPMMAIDQ